MARAFGGRRKAAYTMAGGPGAYRSQGRLAEQEVLPGGTGSASWRDRFLLMTDAEALKRPLMPTCLSLRSPSATARPHPRIRIPCTWSGVVFIKRLLGRPSRRRRCRETCGTCSVHVGEQCWVSPVRRVSTDREGFSHLCEDFYDCGVYPGSSAPDWEGLFWDAEADLVFFSEAAASRLLPTGESLPASIWAVTSPANHLSECFLLSSGTVVTQPFTATLISTDLYLWR